MDDIVPLHLVAYTDGSARPTNPGFNGYGIHGYVYSNLPTKVGTGQKKYLISKDGYIDIKTKTPTENVNVQHYFDIIGPNKYPDSNNVAELNAMIHLFKYALTIENLNSIVVFADSKYVLLGITQWVSGWIENRWMTNSGSPVANRDKWMDLVEMEKAIKARSISISYRKIEAHSGELGNELADTLSVVASNSASNGHFEEKIIVSPASGYWKTETDRHPMLSCRYMYFNSNNNKEKTYYIGTAGAKQEEVFGKRTVETSYSVVKLSESIPEIETVLKAQERLSLGLNSFMRLSLDDLFSKDINTLVNNYGIDALYKPVIHNLSLNAANKTQITNERRPPGLLINAIESLNHLNNLLAIHQRGSKEGYSDDYYASTDITDFFYDIETKEVKGETKHIYTLKKELTSSLSHIDIAVDRMVNNKTVTIKVPIVFGLDLPPRNNLKRMEVILPKVWLFTWKDSELALRYAVVIEAEGCVGIWSNFYSDRIFLLNLG